MTRAQRDFNVMIDKSTDRPVQVPRRIHKSIFQSMPQTWMMIIFHSKIPFRFCVLVNFLPYLEIPILFFSIFHIMITTVIICSIGCNMFCKFHGSSQTESIQANIIWNQTSYLFYSYTCWFYYFLSLLCVMFSWRKSCTRATCNIYSTISIHVSNRIHCFI